MSFMQMIEGPQGHQLAYFYTPAKPEAAGKPGLVFMGGFRSDMRGTKAQALEALCQQTGQSFLRFDYSGHGDSQGDFADGSITDWAGDAIFMIDEVTHGPQILVGSSMGGWIMLLAAMARPQRIAGLVGIAAAPDFTEKLMWAEFDDATKKEIMDKGHIMQDTPYDDEPYMITKRLIEDGRENLLLDDKLEMDVPIRLLQGMQDPDVPWPTAFNILETVSSGDVQINLIKDGDHRLSRPQDISMLCTQVAQLTGYIAQFAPPKLAH